ncbi:prominin-like protein [Drosophila takahashii]|uniref:prominin-like protein n=1 Tax=Drosophila takahashii TaxID=29030 RepID=UPI001CF7F001|nr:prominin-like protein [Drosophila takahashii]
MEVFRILVPLLVLGITFPCISAEVWRTGYTGLGTTHEQMGMVHWPLAEFTQYLSVVNYSETPEVRTGGMEPAYRIGEQILNGIFTDDPPIPPGYVKLRNDDTFVLGPKVEQEEWDDLLRSYMLFIFLVIVVMLIIILIPCLGICYCCFCCCRRCKQGCPPCEQDRDARRRLICGACLFLLILPIILGLVIAFLSNRTLDLGLEDTTKTIKMGSEDTCSFLRDVSDHIHHLFVYNFEEMERHLVNLLGKAHLHVFMDLSDTSEANSMEELERIMSNTPKALMLMKKVNTLEKEMRFLTAQLRDGLRGVKRETNFAVAVQCRQDVCERFMTRNDIQFLDTSTCLNMEGLPDTKVYVDALEKIVDANLAEIPQKGLARLRAVQDKIKAELDRVSPPISRDLALAKETFRAQARFIANAIDAVISQVHLATLNSSKSFDDVYERFNESRSTLNLVVCSLIIFVLVLLIFALLFGCLGTTSTGPMGNGVCSKVTGSWCLLIAIILLFCILSFIFLVGLFYFLLGVVIYEGACAPLRDMSNNTIFRTMEPTVDLMQAMPRGDGMVTPPLKVSTAIQACREDESIFNYLRVNGIYDVDDLIRVQIINNDVSAHKQVFRGDLSTVTLLETDEKALLNDMRNEKLADYHSTLYSKILCNQFAPQNLRTLAERYDDLSETLSYNSFKEAVINFKIQSLHIKAYVKHFESKLQSNYAEITSLLSRIDKMILYENYNFATSIHILLQAVANSEDFIQQRGVHFINTLGQNLSLVVDEQAEEYIGYLMAQCNQNVGHCRPLSYIYDRSIQLVCRRLVDPINGYWVGILLCAFFLIPVLILAHFLMCLYTKIMIVPLVAIGGFAGARNCPICTGEPYVPPPIISCGGGQQAYCGCRISGAGTKDFEMDLPVAHKSSDSLLIITSDDETNKKDD